MEWTQNMFVDLDWPTNARSSPLSASAELLVLRLATLQKKTDRASAMRVTKIWPGQGTWLTLEKNFLSSPCKIWLLFLSYCTGVGPKNFGDAIILIASYVVIITCQHCTCCPTIRQLYVIFCRRMRASFTLCNFLGSHTFHLGPIYPKPKIKFWPTDFEFLMHKKRFQTLR